MKEEIFLKTMIDTVKWGEYKNSDQLLTILMNSIITYNRTGTYGSKSNYYREYVCLRVPVPMRKAANDFKDVLEEIASEVYIEPEDTYQSYEFWGLKILPKPVDLESDPVIEHNVIFDEIKKEIIQGIRSAKYIIWVAVAWFSDEDFFKELLLKKHEGVNIRIIISEEDSNSNMIDKLKRNNFDVVIARLKGNYLRNRLHDKFCIIDLEYVMHGSYNWSKNAQNNDETWATALDRDFVKKFADEFLRLYLENKA